MDLLVGQIVNSELRRLSYQLSQAQNRFAVKGDDRNVVNAMAAQGRLHRARNEIASLILQVDSLVQEANGSQL